MVKKKNKKAAIGIQTNWLFVLIAGAIILIVVFGFIIKQKRASQIKAADTLLKDIEAITTGTTALKGGSQSITLPKTDIEFDCTSDCICTINIGSQNKNFKEKQIFAPKKLTGLKATTWSKDWSIPFRVANFLYITDRSSKYYFIYENIADPLKDNIEKQFPSGINHEFINLNNLENLRNTGFENNKFIFLNTNINSNIDISFRNTASFISLTDSTITFQNTPPINYITEAELFGAVFAADKKMYDCNLDKTKQRTEFIINIYKEKADTLNQLAPIQNLLCGYDSIKSELEALEQDSNIQLHYDIIKSENEALLKQSCPLLY